jgi:hypothetical protein
MIVTLVSCLGCLFLYYMTYQIFPVLYNSKNHKTKYNDQFSAFQRKVNAQKFVSFVHGIISTYGALRCVYPYTLGISSYGKILAFEEPFLIDSVALRFWYLEVTLGYFSADLFLYLQDITQYSFLDVAHHVISIAAYLLGLMSEHATGSFVMISFQTNEISTPFYHLRFFMGLNSSTKQSIWYKLNEATFCVLFLLFRILYNGVILISALYANYTYEQVERHERWVVNVLLVTMFMYYTVQMVWWVRICQIMYYKFFGSKTAIQQEVQLKKNL